MTMSDETIGSALGKRRLELGLEKGQAADKIGMSRTTYSSYERDTQRPSVDVFPALAEFLGVDMEYFLVLYGATCIASVRPSLERTLADENSPEFRQSPHTELEDPIVERTSRESNAVVRHVTDSSHNPEASITRVVPEGSSTPEILETPKTPKSPRASAVTATPESTAAPESTVVSETRRVAEVPAATEVFGASEVTSISVIRETPRSPATSPVPETSIIPDVFELPDYLKAPDTPTVPVFQEVRESPLADFREKSQKNKKKKKKGKNGKK
jgi:transcriptional regulator with XRE-family HTH domain